MSRAFCPSCDREIRPETVQSIAEQIFAKFSSCHSERSETKWNKVEESLDISPDKRLSRDPSTSLRSAQDDKGKRSTTVLITFWVAVPSKTEPRKFFDFLQQQGYLRVCIDNQVARGAVPPESENPKGSARVCRSFRTGSRSLKKIARD